MRQKKKQNVTSILFLHVINVAIRQCKDYSGQSCSQVRELIVKQVLFSSKKKIKENKTKVTLELV